ncbi:hypothetical protein SAMN05444406_1292 [Caldicoprobacter faecalis]|uniref:Uncharacterized protein n=1 Tax=Caldicoprobacter faecalis TaxID=937334 RepID=A0A1I5XPM9_9FIRM|nr:hypothetical protein SAMN05444406_1292 [Caldicoprobacter faecalis]
MLFRRITFLTEVIRGLDEVGISSIMEGKWQHYAFLQDLSCKHFKKLKKLEKTVYPHQVVYIHHKSLYTLRQISHIVLKYHINRKITAIFVQKCLF